MNETVLAATDLSQASDLAVSQAAALAKQWGCGLRLLHVLDDSAWTAARNVFTPAAWGAAEPVIVAARRRLSELAEDIERRQGIAVQPEMRLGKPAEQIAAFTRELDARLLALGRHGENAAPFLGSTALRVAQGVNAPLLTVCDPVPADYSSILVAVDFSDNAHRATSLAAAWFPDAALVLLHAYSLPLESRMRLAEPSVDTIDRYREQEREAAERRMDELRAGLPSPVTARMRTLLRYGHPDVAILDEARQMKADLIVVGRHSGSALGERLLGSVTRNVLDHASTSVLLVP